MNASFVRVALRQIGGWLLLIFFVVLLSTIFSFLGTIFCAALAGMMLGAMRQARWQAVPVSLVFPVVIFLLLRGAKVDLSSSQIRMLSVLCFGTFWLVYGIAVALMRFENKGQTAKRRVDAGEVVTGVTPGYSSKMTAPTRAAVCQELNLATLQGKWLCNGSTAGEPIREKVMEVQKEQMVLRVTDEHGRVTLRANARVRFEKDGVLQDLIIATAESQSASDLLVSI
jgi:hypothetical protein